MARVFDISVKTYGEDDVGSIVALVLMNILRLQKGEGAWILGAPALPSRRRLGASTDTEGFSKPMICTPTSRATSSSAWCVVSPRLPPARVLTPLWYPPHRPTRTTWSRTASASQRWAASRPLSRCSATATCLPSSSCSSTRTSGARARGGSRAATRCARPASDSPCHCISHVCTACAGPHRRV